MTSAELKYLIAISELYDGVAGVSLTAAAEKMQVTKASAHKSVMRLEQCGYIRHNEKNKIIVTESGYERLEKYGMLIGWLTGHLQKNCHVSADIAKNDAIGAVCAFSEESIQGLTSFIASTRFIGAKQSERNEKNDR